ncbi:MAG: aldo/keto reductase [Firmicutes bacterium]|nr:aldo/keto reductase [Bacillota bacterium]
MLYKDFQGLKLSKLGLGCMRLPIIGDDTANIDKEKTAEMIEYAMKNGINYYDTAWPYHNQQSELVVGEILKKYPRDSFYLASKFPGFNDENFTKGPEIFERQLEKCQVDYFDFYLLHNVNEGNVDNYLNKDLGVVEYLLEQKKVGRIRHLGFSCHGQLDVLERTLDAYPELEFCQIQLNWLDWRLQRADEKVALLNSRNVPVWVMEPVRGGKLVDIGEEFEKELKALRPEEGNPAWALRFVDGIPGVTMILSGMSNMDQLKENIKTMAEDKPLSESERATLLSITDEMMRKNTLPCTACRYCIEENDCPMGLNIPRIMAIYNEMLYNNGGTTAPRFMGSLPDDKKPSACIGCGACAAVCPQGLDIPGMMVDFMEKYKGFYEEK